MAKCHCIEGGGRREESGVRFDDEPADGDGARGHVGFTGGPDFKGVQPGVIRVGSGHLNVFPKEDPGVGGIVLSGAAGMEGDPGAVRSRQNRADIEFHPAIGAQVQVVNTLDGSGEASGGFSGEGDIGTKSRCWNGLQPVESIGGGDAEVGHPGQTDSVFVERFGGHAWERGKAGREGCKLRGGEPEGGLLKESGIFFNNGGRYSSRP